MLQQKESSGCHKPDAFPRPYKKYMGILQGNYTPTVAVLKILYAASVWLTSIQHKGEGIQKSKGSVGAATKLVRVQRMVAIHITGALQTTANDVLDAHTDILPMDLLIDKYCF